MGPINMWCDYLLFSPPVGARRFIAQRARRDPEKVIL